MSGKPWSLTESATLSRLYPDTDTPAIAKRLGRSLSSVYQHAYALKLKKSAAYMARQREIETQRLKRVGICNQFRKGQRAWNAGMKGLDIGGKATRFKKGNKPQTWAPVGSERISKDDILQRKVSDTGYPPRDWRAVHALVWEAANGPIPPGHIVVFRDHNKRNFAIDNLELISRAQNIERNSIHRYPEEVKQAIRLVGKLNRTIERAEREKQD